jgi:hypothetical protein
VCQPDLDVAVFKAAAERLSHAEIGALTCVALALTRGPANRLELGWRAAVPPDMLDRLDAWLAVSPESGLVTGLVVPSLVPAAPRGPRQELLFDGASAAPVPAQKRGSGSIHAATIAAGVRVLGRAGISEKTAGAFLGEQAKLHGFGALAEAVDALAKNRGDVANPRGWIVGFIQNQAHRRAGAATGRVSPASGTHRVPSAAEKPRPLATPEFLGISPGRAKMIVDRNRELEEETRRRFAHLRKGR